MTSAWRFSQSLNVDSVGLTNIRQVFANQFGPTCIKKVVLVSIIHKHFRNQPVPSTHTLVRRPSTPPTPPTDSAPRLHHAARHALHQSSSASPRDQRLLVSHPYSRRCIANERLSV